MQILWSESSHTTFSFCMHASCMRPCRRRSCLVYFFLFLIITTTNAPFLFMCRFDRVKKIHAPQSVFLVGWQTGSVGLNNPFLHTYSRKLLVRACSTCTYALVNRRPGAPLRPDTSPLPRTGPQRESEREMCPWAISIMFWWLSAKHI